MVQEPGQAHPELELDFIGKKFIRTPSKFSVSLVTVFPVSNRSRFYLLTIYYAIGDIHGRDDLLETLHDRIVAYHQARHEGIPATLVHIGDYIDGGANSLGVIDRLMKGITGSETVCLKGNHEELLLACLGTDNRQAWSTWLRNSGDETLASLGVAFRFGGCDPSLLAEALGEQRIAWLRSLPLYHETPHYLFVHAGIVPGRPLKKQEERDLLWIRGRFLEYEGDHGVFVVHGHTPSDEPVVLSNRIGIDVGATSNGKLTAVVLDRTKYPYFLTVEGVPGKGPRRR